MVQERAHVQRTHCQPYYRDLLIVFMRTGTRRNFALKIIRPRRLCSSYSALSNALYAYRNSAYLYCTLQYVYWAVSFAVPVLIGQEYMLLSAQHSSILTPSSLHQDTVAASYETHSGEPVRVAALTF